MIEYVTPNMHSSIKCFRANVVNIKNDGGINRIGTSSRDSNNYAGKERTTGEFGGLIETFIGDKRVSYMVTSFSRLPILEKS